MTGADLLIKTLLANGINTCFMNPGTSEMHFVAALDNYDEFRSVLCLFEGVATGAADGYARVKGKPAAVLLHLGPGLANGLANLHNAKKGFTPVLVVVGDHAIYHRQYDAPLSSNVFAVAEPFSKTVIDCRSELQLEIDTVSSIKSAMEFPKGVATLILPADVAWSDAPEQQNITALINSRGAEPDANLLDQAKELLKLGPTCALLIGGNALDRECLNLCGGIEDKFGVRIFAETFPSAIDRGLGTYPVSRLGYLAEFMEYQLNGVEHLILVGAKPPISFFAYPNKRSFLVPEGASLLTLCASGQDAKSALLKLAESLEISPEYTRVSAAMPEIPPGSITPESMAKVVSHVIEEGMIISDESNTGGLFLASNTESCPPHKLLCLTGGAIGQGLPLATGAAIASPENRVLAIESDGSSMYTIQSLWTQAREGLNVTTLLLDNRRYAILEMELGRVGAQAVGERSKRMLDISDPEIDFASIARSMGVPSERVETNEDLLNALQRANSEEGPYFIHARLPVGMGY